MEWGKATLYFKSIVLNKREYLKPEWIAMARNKKEIVKEEIQRDGRIRRWVYIKEANKYLRVIFLEDGETVHNAFFDRNFKKEVLK